VLARQIVFYAVVVSLLALVAAFWAARLVSSPLRRLSAQMAGFSLDEAPAGQVPSARVTRLAELAGLNQAFERLQTELKQSFAEAVLLRAHKHRAQLLALQAQMNPHFMFNMLATISVMAENGQAATIPAIVDDLAEMMRYIASSEEGGHTLGQEFAFVRRYLQCQKHRFRDDLVFAADCPPDLAGTPVPRLLLQPFIENAIKHSTRQRPPWHLEVKAGHDGSDWWVLIEDNGPGFSPDSLDWLRRELARINSLAPGLADLPDLHVQGLGMINTFIRLRLAYGDRAVMEPQNRPGGGARVRLGGSLNA
jgi:two-component system sensor histidine kinase YesM